SYTYADMDGETTIVTLACELAFERGVVTITSAGNEGNSSWFYITAPADGFNTIAVGAVTSTNIVASFSSHGPTADGRIKPDILTQGVGVFAASASGFTNYTSSFGGTSAAAPLACGIAGLLLSAHPHLTNVQVREIFHKTSDNASTPDNERGYGLASAQNVINYPNLEPVNDTYKMHKAFIGSINVNPATVKLNYSIESGDFQEVDMTFDGNFRHNYTFPDLSTNQYLEFYFVYNDVNGTSYREPLSGNYGQFALDTEVVSSVPQDFVLNQNYPNPFNNQTKINFTAPVNESVELSVFNILGQKVKQLFNGNTITGRTIVNWNGQDDFGNSVSSGIYFYSLKSKDKVISKKMVLLK
ncbi:MAG: T9SS C-terminal target domain-containing protein, partial [Ignavibacteriales bacterium]